MKRGFLIVVLMGIFPLQLSAHEFFPLEVGYWWQYDGIEVDSLGDPIPGTEYESFSTIIGDTLISGFTYYVMQDSSNESGSWEVWEDTYVRSAGDTVKMLMPFMDDPTDLIEINMAILPDPIGMTWTVLYLDTFIVEMGDTMNVVWDWTGEILDTNSITVPVGTLDNVYHLYYLIHLEFSYTFPETTIVSEMEMEIWVAQDVGPARFFQLPVLEPDPEPGSLEELADYVTPVERIWNESEPVTFALEPAYPNPFNPSTRISFSLAKPAHAEVIVYNLSGQEIARLLQGWRMAGSYQLSFDGSGLPSGIYLVRLRAGEYLGTEKVILLK